MSIEDRIIEKYSDILQEIYDKKTAGDHTFVGVLARMLWDLEKQRGAEEKEKLSVLYERALNAMKQTGPPMILEPALLEPKERFIPRIHGKREKSTED